MYIYDTSSAKEVEKLFKNSVDWLLSVKQQPSSSNLFIRAPVKFPVNQPLYIGIVDSNSNPVPNAQVIFKLGGAQFGPYTADSNGYILPFTPQSTGTLTINASNGINTTTATVEIIESTSTGCTVCSARDAKGKVSLVSMSTDKLTYSRGQTIVVTATLQNDGTCTYPVYTNSNSLSASGSGLFSIGNTINIAPGTKTIKFSGYIPASAETGTYTIKFFWSTGEFEFPEAFESATVTVQ